MPVTDQILDVSTPSLPLAVSTTWAPRSPDAASSAVPPAGTSTSNNRPASNARLGRSRRPTRQPAASRPAAGSSAAGRVQGRILKPSAWPSRVDAASSTAHGGVPGYTPMGFLVLGLHLELPGRSAPLGARQAPQPASKNAFFQLCAVCSATPARRAASATDTSPRSTDNTTCSLRSGLLFEGLTIRISSRQTQPRPEQEFLTRDTTTHFAVRPDLM